MNKVSPTGSREVAESLKSPGLNIVEQRKKNEKK
jgi:hypothetical protein